MSGDNTITPNVNNDGCNGRTGDERPNHKGTDPMPADFTVIGRAWFGAVFDGLKAALKVAAPLVTTNPTATPVVIGVTSCIAKGVSFHGEWCRNPELQEQIRLGTADLEENVERNFVGRALRNLLGSLLGILLGSLLGILLGSLLGSLLASPKCHQILLENPRCLRSSQRTHMRLQNAIEEPRQKSRCASFIILVLYFCYLIFSSSKKCESNVPSTGTFKNSRIILGRTVWTGLHTLSVGLSQVHYVDYTHQS